jgi:hypothetical protein
LRRAEEILNEKGVRKQIFTLKGKPSDDIVEYANKGTILIVMKLIVMNSKAKDPMKKTFFEGIFQKTAANFWLHSFNYQITKEEDL